MKKFVKRNLFILAGLLSGAVAGYFYQRANGCSNGTCTITASPWNSMAYGTLLGALLGSVLQDFKKKPA